MNHRIDNKELRKLVFAKYDGRCAYCGIELKERFSIDHIHPLYRNNPNWDRTGLNHIDNYNPCCFSCNSSKSTWTIEEWRKEIELKFTRLHRDSSNFRLLVRMGIIPSEPSKFKFYFERSTVDGTR